MVGTISAAAAAASGKAWPGLSASRSRNSTVRWSQYRGDGSAMYSIPALWTAAHHDLNILFVVLSNREYRILKHNADAYRLRFNAPSNNPYPYMDLSDPFIGFVDVGPRPGCGRPADHCPGRNPGRRGRSALTSRSVSHRSRRRGKGDPRLTVEGPYLAEPRGRRLPLATRTSSRRRRDTSCIRP